MNAEGSARRIPIPGGGWVRASPQLTHGLCHARYRIINILAMTRTFDIRRRGP